MPFTIPEWILELHRSAEQERAIDPLGTARFIDADARLRGLAAAGEGMAVSLSRPYRLPSTHRITVPRYTSFNRGCAKKIGSPWRGTA